jgi:hypothetical protein
MATLLREKEPQYKINTGDIFQEQIRVNKNKTYNMISYNVPFLPTYQPTYLPVSLSMYLSYLSYHIYQILYANYFH